MAAPTAPPTNASSPPSEATEYSFSLSRSTGKFRFRSADGEWLCDRMAGRWEMLGTDPEHGNLNVRCQLRIEDGTAYVYAPRDVVMEEVEAEVPEGSTETHWRLCYNRAGRSWRLRDERSGQLHSDVIKDYRGVMNVNWFDKGTHIFHDGPVYVDGLGVAHFKP